MERGSIGRRPFVAGAAGLAGAVGALAGAGTATAQGATPEAAGHPVVGSWLVAVTFEGQPPTELTSLVTYFADGNVLVANAGEAPGMPAGSGLTFTESHGRWAPRGERGADATFVFLTLNPTGGVASVNAVRTAVEVDAGGDAYAGRAVLDMASRTGGAMGGGRGSMRATRITVEPLANGAATPAP